MVGSFIGLGLTIGWWPTIFMYCFVWGNNLERKITNEKPKG